MINGLEFYNDRGYGHLAVCGSIRCRTATKVKAGAKPPKCNTPANAHRRVLCVIAKKKKKSSLTRKTNSQKK